MSEIDNHLSTATGQMYHLRWTQVSDHEVTISAGELAELMDVPLSELAELVDAGETPNLDDALANLDDDGFIGLTREDIEISPATTEER